MYTVPRLGISGSILHRPQYAGRSTFRQIRTAVSTLRARRMKVRAFSQGGEGDKRHMERFIELSFIFVFFEADKRMGNDARAILYHRKTAAF